MSDIKFFLLANDQAPELQGNPSDLEKPLQKLFENNLEQLLGIRFLATEQSTGKTHAGRIDSAWYTQRTCSPISAAYLDFLNKLGF